MNLSAWIPGTPVAKGRPKLSTQGGFARAYTPKKTREWEAYAAEVLREAWGDEKPINAACRAVVVAAWPTKDKRKWNTCKTTRPDVDNVAKAVLDAAQAAGVLVDDARVVSLRVSKYYTKPGLEGVQVVISAAFLAGEGAWE